MNAVDAYIKRFSEEVQAALQGVRAAIRAAAPRAEEEMCYGIPTFRLDGKNLVHFAAFKKHIGFYPTPSGIAAFKDTLAQYTTAKGSVQFPLDRPIPYPLIKKVTVFRVKEVTAQTKGKLPSKKGEK